MGGITGYNENAQKLTISKEYIILNAGSALNSRRIQTQNSQKVTQSILNSKKITKKKMKNLLNIISTEFKNTINMQNRITFTILKGEKLNSAYIPKKQKNKHYTTIGDGKQLAKDFLKKEIKHYIKNNKIYCSIESATQLAIDTLKYAAYFSDFIGGKANIAIATQKGIIEMPIDISLNKI